MRHIRVLSAVVAALLAPGAFAQSQSNGVGTGTATSNASNQGANSSSNNSSAFQNAASNSTSTNSQNNGSASNLNATINIVNPVPASTTSSSDAAPLRSESVLKQSLDTNSRSEQVISGEQTQRVEYGGTYTIKNVPSMNAPPLISSNDTCMGSASGGVSVAGFGLSGGSTYTDEHCKRIKMSRELWNKGMKAASLAMDCMDRDARDALELTGYTCPQTLRAQRAAEAAQEQQAALYRPAGRGTYPPPLPREGSQPLLAADPTVAPATSQVGASSTDPTPQGNVLIRRVNTDYGAQARGDAP